MLENSQFLTQKFGLGSNYEPHSSNGLHLNKDKTWKHMKL